MHSLPEIQSRFYQAMMSGTGACLAADLGDIVEGQEASLQRRLAAYRRNAFGNLCHALATTYPVVKRIVGEAFFREAARQYISDHPSLSGDLNDYGEGFSEFLAAYPYARELPYLAAVAQLEWAVQAVLAAADPAPVDMGILAQVSPDHYGELRFHADSRCIRMDSDWPVSEIWRVNQDGYPGDMRVDFSQNERVLIGLHPGRLAMVVLNDAEAVFFDALSQQASLTDAVEAALGRDENFDFGKTLQQWIGSGLLRSVSLPQ